MTGRRLERPFHCYSRPMADAQLGVAFWEGVANAGRFFMGDADVHRANFPDPSLARTSEHGAFLPLPRLVELKLASGMSAPDRLKDLADVVELIRATGIERAFADELDESVQPKFLELWEAAQALDPEQ
jgi:hypothetical protein